MLRKKKYFFGKALKLFERKVCYEHLLSKEEIERFGVNALDILDVKLKMDCVIVAVVHDEFKKMELEDVSKFMNNKPIIVDVRRMFDEEEAKRKGFYYKRL